MCQKASVHCRADAPAERSLELPDGVKERQALREVGIVDPAVLGEGERARIESLQKDAASLRRRYARWFPDPAQIGQGASGLPISI